MGTQNSNDDCYFYFYSSCTKGDECPYRHCEAALGTETVCTLWKEGRCYRKCCKFRHMESRINRSCIPCYWENKPGGCRKPHCVFFHMKPRYNISSTAENQGLILPVSSQPHSPAASITVIDPVPDSVKMFSSHESNDSLALSPPSHPVPPVVVSFDEESDTESTTSTPVKASSSEGKLSNVVGKTLSLNAPQDSELLEDRDLGIKTLEQIKMEKIHRESEHFYNTENADDKNIDMKSIEQIRIEKLHRDSENFYGTEYDTHMNEMALHEELPPANTLYQGEAIYPTEPSDVLCQNADDYSLGEVYAFDESNSSNVFGRVAVRVLKSNHILYQVIDENAPANSHDISVEDNPLSRDLRDILKQKRAGQQKQTDKDPSRKRIISLKRSFRQVEDESPAVTVTFNEQQTSKDDCPAVKVLAKEPETKDILGFRIKTLEEIRKEKETRQDKINNESCEILTDSASAQAKEDSLSIRSVEPVSADESKENSQTKICKQISPKRKLKRRSMELYKPPAILKNETVLEEHSLLQEDVDTSQPFSERIYGKVVDKKPKSDARIQILHNDSMNKVDQLKLVTLSSKTDLNGDYKALASLGKRPFSAIDVSLKGKKSETLNTSFEQQNITVKNADHEVLSEHNGIKKLKVEQDKSKSTQQKVTRPLIRRHVFQLKHIVPEDHLPALTIDKHSLESEIPSTDSTKFHQSLEETNHQENLEPDLLTENITANDDFSSGDQIVLAKREKRTSTISSVEDFDNLLLGGETDISLDEVEVNTDDKAEDILLELEQILNS